MPEAVATTHAMLADARTMFARLFVPIDFTMSSHRALGVALELKRAFGSEVCLFQLATESGGDEFLGGLGDPSSPADLIDGAKKHLQRFVENIAPEFVNDVEVRACFEMKPVEDVRKEARRWRATMVIAATQFDGLFRSPAEKLVHGFDLPVLLIPPVEVGPINFAKGAPPTPRSPI